MNLSTNVRKHPLWMNLIRTFSKTQHAKKYIVIENTDEFVTKVINSDTPVMVNFHAEWCVPCHTLTPRLIKLIEGNDKLILATIDVEKNPDLVHTFEVKAVPAVLAFKDGHVIDKFIGTADVDTISVLINKLTCDKINE